MAKMLKSQILRESKKKHDIKEQILIENQKNDDVETDDDDDDADDDDDDADDDDDDADDDDDDADDDDDDADDDDDDADDDDDDDDADGENESDDHRKSKRKPLIIKDFMTSLVIPKGTYDAMIADITVENKQGKFGKFNFLDIHLIVLVDGEEVEIKDRMTVNINENSKLSKLIFAVLGKTPKIDFDLDTLIEEEIGVKITHRKDENGRTWPEIEYIR